MVMESVKGLLIRLLKCSLAFVIVVCICFCLLRLMPVEGYFSDIDKLSQEQIKEKLHILGLDQPITKQLPSYLKGLMHGTLGTSTVYRVGIPVETILKEKAPISVKIGLCAVSIAILGGMPIGLWMAGHRGKRAYKPLNFLVLLLDAIPAACFHMLFQVFGAQILRLPMLYERENPLSLLLPVLSLGFCNISFYAIWLKRYATDEMYREYIGFARSGGISERRVLYRHLLPNCVLPMLQYLPTTLMSTLVGSLYVEALYGIPGMGGLLVDVIRKQDNAMVQGITIVYCATGIIGMLLGDLLLVLADPRLTLARKGVHSR